MEMQIVKYEIMMKKKNNVKPWGPWRVLLECCLTTTLVFCFHWNPGETVRSKEQIRLALNGHNTTISTSTTITIGATISSTNHWNITNTIKTTYSWQQSIKDVFFRMFQNLPLNPGKRITLKEKKNTWGKKHRREVFANISSPSIFVDNCAKADNHPFELCSHA